EDGIRDRNVTGVQTCALPIYRERVAAARLPVVRRRDGEVHRAEVAVAGAREGAGAAGGDDAHDRGALHADTDRVIDELEVAEEEIGRASCRERGGSVVGMGWG